MTALKHPSFHEEKEVRCIHAVNLESDESSMKFIDNQEDGNELTGRKIEFRTTENALSAYLDIPVCSEKHDQPIAEIIIGPKNNINHNNLLLFLGGLGYKNVLLKSSSIPYR